MVRFLGSNETALEILNPFDSIVPRQRYLRNRGSFQGVDFGCTANSIFFSWNDGGVDALNVWRFDRQTGTRRRLTNFTGGVVREVDHDCAGAQVRLQQASALKIYASVFDLQAWNAAVMQGSIDLAGVPTSINDIITRILTDAASSNSETATLLQNSGNAILQLVGSAAQWQAISGSLVLSYMDQESASNGYPPLSNVLIGLANQIQQNPGAKPNVGQALAVARLYKDMIDNPQNHVGAQEAFAFNGAVLNNFHKTLSSLIPFLQATGQP